MRSLTGFDKIRHGMKMTNSTRPISKHQTELQSLERFFRSGWFELLSGLDGEVLMKKIQEGGYRQNDGKAISIPSLPDERAHQFRLCPELDRLRDLATSLSGVNYDGVRVSRRARSTGSALRGKTICKIIDARDER